MAQYDFGTIDPNTKSGTALASDLNSWRNAVHSNHSGSTAPSYATGSMLWSDTTSANFELKMYDGAQWIPVAVLDATNNVARVAVDSAETSYITATTAAQIKFVIANVDTVTVRSTGLQFNIASPVISDSNNNELLSFTTTASAVNKVNIANSATGNAPTISAIGNDTNIGVTIATKGTGVVTALVETSATNTVIDAARIETRSSGTPATGIGTGLLFVTETAAGNFEIGARIEAITTDVTSTSEDFDLSFKVMAAGAAATEVMRIRSTGVVDVDGLSIGGTTVTATAAELNFVDGVTSNVQTQLDARYTSANLASQAEAEAGTDNTKLMTPLRVRNALNASGSAPTYACRAWVNFNGTGTVAIRASGNVSSITDNGTGEYTVNFATALPDANYCALVGAATDNTAYAAMISSASAGGAASVKTASALQIRFRAGSTFADAVDINVAVFR